MGQVSNIGVPRENSMANQEKDNKKGPLRPFFILIRYESGTAF